LTDDRWRDDPLLAIIGSRQYEQWQSLRHLDASSTEVALRVEKLCENISKALQQPWLSPQERQEAEARRIAEDERLRQQKLQQEARRVAEEEHRRQESEAKRLLGDAEVQKRRQDNERRKLEKQAAWAAKQARALHLLRGKTAAGTAVVALLLIGGIWLYRTTVPAVVTSAAQEKQTAENATPQANAETTKPAGATSASVQPDTDYTRCLLTPSPSCFQSPESAQRAKQEEAMRQLREFTVEQGRLAESLQKEANTQQQRTAALADKLIAGDAGVKIETLGLTVADMSDDLRKRYNIKNTVNGIRYHRCRCELACRPVRAVARRRDRVDGIQPSEERQRPAGQL